LEFSTYLFKFKKVLTLKYGPELADTVFAMKLLSFRFLVAVLVCFAQLRAVSDVIYDLPTPIHSIDARIDLLNDPITRTVVFSTYEIVMDEAGTTFLAALIQAAERGVKIRGIIDNKITKSHPELVTYLAQKGIELVFHNPIKFNWDLLRNPIQTVVRYNQRLHDKMFIVNSSILLLGDKNYANKYYPQLRNVDPKAGYVKGREVVMTGDGVSSYVAYFEDMWSFYKSMNAQNEILNMKAPLSDRLKTKFDKMFATSMQWLDKRKRKLVDWRKNRFEYESAEIIQDSIESGAKTLAEIFEKIANAKPGTKVLIENGYLVLFPELRSAIAKAMENKVDVILNLNKKSELWLMDLALKVDLEELVRLGLKVYLNRNYPTHAKMILLENIHGQKEVILTSANIDPRSYSINTESGFAIKSAELFDHYWEQFNNHKDNKVFHQNVGSCEAFYAKSSMPGSAKRWQKNFINIMRPQL